LHVPPCRLAITPAPLTLVEGAATIALGLSVPFLLVDSPKTAKWLSPDESRYLLLAVHAQDGGAKTQAKAEGIDWHSIKQVFTDWHLYLFCIIYWAGTIPNYGACFLLCVCHFDIWLARG
jgi:hypothetical protein